MATDECDEQMFVIKCIQNNKINKKSGVMPLNLKKVKKVMRYNNI
jgi:hypothetical protein